MKFAEVVGQEAVKSRLVKTVNDHRISHAQLFLGPQGSGKLSLAIAYAQFINCTNKQNNDSCGICPSCIKYAKLIHPDLHFIYPTAKTKSFDKPISKNFLKEWRELVISANGYITLPAWSEKIGIEKKQAIINVRDCNVIISTLSYKSYEAEYKVMIIWMVEKLFHSAAPKILKILEEPPDKTLFILVSENQEQIINTILSRTQLVKIPSLIAEDISAVLVKEGYDHAVVNDAVRLANGNFIEAKKLLEKAGESSANFDWFSGWMRICYAGKVQPMLDYGSEFSRKARDTQKNLLIYSLRMVRESVMVNMGEDKLVRLTHKESGFVQKFHPYINQKNIQLFTNELNESIFHIERNANSGLLFFDMSIKFAKYLKM